MQALSMNDSKSSDARAYCLNWDISHIYDVDVDAWLIPFPGAPDISAFWRIKERLDLPDRVEFDAIGPVLDEIDYLYTDVEWPIMSKKMLSVLLSVGDFRHISYPIIMTNCERIRDPKTGQKYQPRIENHNYFAVHVLEDLDVFDMENSIYEYSKRNPSVIPSAGIKKAVFREPPGGFPPLFRVPQLRTQLYISAEAQTALEVAGIRGVSFRRVSDNRTVKSLP